MHVMLPRESQSPTQFEAFPPHQVGGGRRASRAESLHAHALSRLGGELIGTFGPGRGAAFWLLLQGPTLHFAGELLTPDLVGWRREHSSLPDTLSLLPDWVCEVLTPSSGSLERLTKLPLYARAGVRQVWLVDPERRTLEVLRLEGRRYSLLALHSGDDNVRAEPFQSLTLPLRLLWGE